jgi:hypothetical protein
MSEEGKAEALVIELRSDAPRDVAARRRRATGRGRSSGARGSAGGWGSANADPAAGSHRGLGGGGRSGEEEVVANQEAPEGGEELREEFRLLRRSLEEMLANTTEQQHEVKALLRLVEQYHEAMTKLSGELARGVAEADRLAQVAIGVLLYKGLVTKEELKAVSRHLADEEFVRMMKRMMGESGTRPSPEAEGP